MARKQLKEKTQELTDLQSLTPEARAMKPCLPGASSADVMFGLAMVRAKRHSIGGEDVPHEHPALWSSSPFRRRWTDKTNQTKTK